MRLFCVIIVSITISHLHPRAMAQHEIWGVTAEGGKYDQGCIFKTDQDGNNQQIMHSFSQSTGIHPKGGHPVEASNGKIYGLVSSSTAFSLIIFEYDPGLERYQIVYQHANKGLGYEPNSALISGYAPKLYGMTTRGGDFDQGVLFEFDFQKKFYHVLHHFDDAGGCEPYGSLCMAENGLLYGLTYRGGIYDEGVIFQYNPAIKTYTKLIDLNAEQTGSYPRGHLIQASDKQLYGMTRLGGVYDMGTIFRYDPDSRNFENLLDFDGRNLGSNPYGGLAESQDLVLYGMTFRGAAYNKGTLFEFDVQNNVFKKLHDFNSADGSNPAGNVLISNNNLVGMTSKGGTFDCGILFEYDLEEENFIKVLDFKGRINGKFPLGDLMLTSLDRYFGYCSGGGLYDEGTLFELTTAGEIFNVVDFNDQSIGYFPVKIIFTSDGSIYGINQRGGTNGQGTLFNFDPAGHSIVKLHDFKAENEKLMPMDLLQSSTGELYGIVSNPSSSKGSFLYRYNINTSSYFMVEDTFPHSGANKMYYYSSYIDHGGASPLVSLVESIDQKVVVNQINGTGSVGYWDSEFHYENGSAFYLFDVNRREFMPRYIYNGGGNCYGSPLLASDGMYYVMSYDGGYNYGMGKIVSKKWRNEEWSYGFKEIVEFKGSENGAYPKGALIETQDHGIYGMTTRGGIYDRGVIFKINDYTRSFEKVYDFEGDEYGGFPEGRLLESETGQLYGTTSAGGAHDLGIFFEFDPETRIFQKKFDFNGKNGSKSIKSNLTINRFEEITSLKDNDLSDSSDILIYPNPARNELYISCQKQYREIGICLYNVLGDKVLDKQYFNLRDIVLPIDYFKPGMYIIRLENVNGSISYKILIQ